MNATLNATTNSADMTIIVVVGVQLAVFKNGLEILFAIKNVMFPNAFLMMATVIFKIATKAVLIDILQTDIATKNVMWKVVSMMEETVVVLMDVLKLS